MPLFITIILDILGNLPAIFSIIKSIIALISGLNGPAKAKAYQDLSDAYQDFKKTGDNTKLKQLHDQLAVGQAPDTVTE